MSESARGGREGRAAERFAREAPPAAPGVAAGADGEEPEERAASEPYSSPCSMTLDPEDEEAEAAREETE